MAERRGMTRAMEMAAAVWRLLLARLADDLGVGLEEVLVADPSDTCEGVTRGIGQARRIAMYLMNTELDIPPVTVAEIAGITRQGVFKATRIVEDRRDDPEFDALIERHARPLRHGRWLGEAA